MDTNLKVECEYQLENGVLSLTGDVTHAIEEEEKCSVLKAAFAVDITLLEFTRTEVLERLYKNMAHAARSGGPYSKVVEAFEQEIENVKNGGELAPHAWMFEVEG